ncbi:transporter substrate-binding domain-containing protein [Oribacterium sinus]|uniref:Arginine ABC transporter, periplasmic arginine-binding protein ArtP n=1 Tax=Oribacterium sinus F0268 TaxID=585501 RepID=C2KZ27_9FIRM|nr:transporter substrate-binding domain-containing protein [Oribacterium sinus]EEJ50977.1 arginine ABC transporter, periplasmic arginine-binding protein ArtP [Oribacterium sinus F0268]
MHKRAAFFGNLTVLPLFLFVLFFAFALSSCGKKSTGKIQGREVRLGIDRDNAPFSYLDEEKNPAGFDVELIEAIARLEGFTVKFVPMNPSALQSAVVTGTIVGAMGGIEIREEKQLSFSEAYGSSTLGLLYGDQSSASEQMPSLQGKSILVKEGSGTAVFLESIRQKEGFSLLVVQENQDLIREWLEGKGDFIAEDLPVLEAMKEEIPKIDETGRTEDYLPPDLLDISEFDVQKEKNSRAGQNIEIFSLKEEQHYGLMVGMGQNKELLRAFVRGLKKMKENGEWEALTKKYSLFSSNSNPQ